MLRAAVCTLMLACGCNPILHGQAGYTSSLAGIRFTGQANEPFVGLLVGLGGGGYPVAGHR